MVDFTQTDSTREAITSIRKGSESYTKCLTEITLNSHESFRRIKKADPNKKIDDYVLIRADSRDEFFEVIDHFAGIADDEKSGMEILQIKGRGQETHTEDSRSAMGRGMSDVLFRFLNQPSIVAWRRNGETFAYICKWVQDSRDGELKRTFEDQRKINPNLIERVEKLIPNTGTYVKFWWKEEDEDLPFPTKDEIKNHLGYYYELKNILSGDQFSYNLEYVNQDGTVDNDRIRFVEYDVTEVAALGKKPLDKIKLDSMFAIKCKCWHDKSDHSNSGCNKCEKCNGFCNDYDVSILSAKIFKSKTRLNPTGETKTQGIYFEGEHEQVYCMEDLYDLNGRYIESIYYYVIVVLSADAKNYMMNMSSVEIGEQILSSTRHGFEHSKKNRLYHESKAILKPWIEGHLKNDSKIVIESENSLSDEYKKEFNKMMEEIMEMEDAKGTDGNEEGGDKNKTDLLEFKSKSYFPKVSKRSKIYLLFNPDKFAAGSKVTWKSDNTAIKIFPTVKSIPRAGNKIPLAIQSDIKCKGTISATVKTREGKSVTAKTLIHCVEPEDIDPPIPTEYLEFFPKTVTTKILSTASVKLYAHPTEVKPGTKIEVSFTPDSGFSKLQDISIKEPKSVTISNPTYNFDFEQEDSEMLQKSKSYRKTAISFEGKQPGLTGTLTAKATVGAAEFTATCKINFKDPEGDEGGFLKDWVVQKLRGGHVAFVYQDGKCIANSEVPHVKTMLSDDDATAKKRFKLFQETKLFVMTEQMKLGFQMAMDQKYNDRHRSLRQEGFDDSEIFTRLLDEMRDWEHMYADSMMEAMGVRPRTDVPSDIYPHKISVQVGKNFGQYEISCYPKGEKDPFGNENFREPELQIPIKKSLFNFSHKGDNMIVGVYSFNDGTVAARLDFFVPGTKTEPVFRQIRDAVQIYKKPEKEIQGIPKDWVYTPVDISIWKDNVLKEIQITADDNMVLKIPDSPNPLGKKIPEEDDDTWIYEDEPLVRYALYEDAEPSNGSSNRKGQLVSFLDPENLHYVALNYVRHRIMRPLAVFDFISRDIEKIDERKCEKCGLDANTSKVVSDNFSYYLDDEKPGLQTICKDCERTADQHDKQMGDAFL